ncbi:MAG: four helix bundle protein [Patescibacteria group bacterium]|jgi:hypothetical protein
MFYLLFLWYLTNICKAYEQKSCKDLIVWQKAIRLTVEVYKLTESFPKNELFGLTSQMRRAAVSIVSNIAEGYERRSQREFLRFLLISFGSAAELETQMIIAKSLKYSNQKAFVESEQLLSETSKITFAFIKKIKLRLFPSR